MKLPSWAPWAAGVAWLVLALMPFAMHAFQVPFEARLLRRSYPLLLSSALMLHLTELMLLWLLVRLARPNKWLFAGALGLVGAVHLINLLSWAYLVKTGAFLPARVLGLYPFVFTDPNGFWNVLSRNDQLSLASVVLGSFLFAGMAGLAAQVKPWKPLALACAVAAIGCLLVHGRVGWRYSHEAHIEKLYRDGLTPSATVLWMPLFNPVPAVQLPAIPESAFPVADKTFVEPDAGGPDVFVFVIEGLRSDVATAPEHRAASPYFHSLQAHPLSQGRAWASATETSESMYVMLTGTYPLQSTARGMRTELKSPFLFEELKHAGYSTAFLGEAWEIDADLTRRAVDHRFDPTIDPATPDPHRGAGYSLLLADRAKLRNLLGWVQRTPGPLASITYLQASHYPYNQTGVKRHFRPARTAAKASYLGYPEEDAVFYRNAYANLIRELDRMVHAFVRRLDKKRPDRERIILITGDHGELFGEHGEVTHAGSIWPEVVEVPLLFDAPDRWSPSRLQPSGHIDLAPTLLSMIGHPVPQGMQGFPLVGRQAPHPRPLFITSQLRVDEDAVVREGLTRISYDRGELKGFGSGDPISDCACILGYRASQLRYHDPLRPMTRRLPRRYQRCDDDPVVRSTCERMLEKR